MRSLASVCTVALLIVISRGRAIADPPPVAAAAVVTVSLDPDDADTFVPDDFAGLSIGARALQPAPDGSRLFSADNGPLVDLFRTLGVRSLRLVGDSADSTPTNDDLDHAFGFAHAIGAKVIYVLPMQNVDEGVRVATYLMGHYPSDVSCFSVGNEPTVYRNDYAAHVSHVKDYITAVTAPEAAPGAMFCGCSTTPAFGTQWSAQFANDLGPSQRLRFVGQHFYPGGNSKTVAVPADGRDELLNPAMLTTYQQLYDNFVPTVQQNHLTFRLDETNSFYYGGAAGVSDTHAAALWALDYMHWWAQHGALGVNFHTSATASPGRPPNPYSVFLANDKGLDARPLAYAMKAFALGGHGAHVPIKVQSDGPLPNLRTYAWLASDDSLNVTLINCEHGEGAKPMTVSLETADNGYQHGRMITMNAPANGVSATSGLTIGGGAIENDGTWDGKWQSLPPATASGEIIVTLPPATASVVGLSR